MQTFNRHHSKSWGGRVSDVHLTENCALLSTLLPGGCTVQKSRYVLLQVEIDTACQLSQVRIHVERVIRLVRQKFSILQSILSTNMLKGDEGEHISY